MNLSSWGSGRSPIWPPNIFCVLAMGALCLCMNMVSPVRGQDRLTDREYEIKAAFVYHFARFIDWPSAKDSNEVAVCILGENPLGSAFHHLEGKTVGQKTLTTRHLEASAEANECHILFLAASTGVKPPEISKEGLPRGVLTVGETDSFIDNGGIIRLFTAGNNVRFEINRDAADHAGLRISSRMLRLAENS